MNENTISHTKQEIEDWIGNFDGLREMSEEKAEKLLNYLQENEINIENPGDIEKAMDFVNNL